MNEIIKDLYPINRLAIGEGIDNAFLYLNKLIPLEMSGFMSGAELGDWTIPNEWVVNEAWVKYNGQEILNYTDQPLCLAVNSKPFKGTLTLAEFKKHIMTSEESPDAYLYSETDDWAVSIPKNKLVAQSLSEDGSKIETVNLLQEGEYEVCIDTEFRPGEMKVGVHTIKGKTKKEILLFAHLDGPYQANANLSGVATLVELVKHIKPRQIEHTIKLVFGSKEYSAMVYKNQNELSQVDFMVALEGVGNENEQGVLLQWAFDREARINTVAHLALRSLGKGYRQSKFKTAVSAEEFFFNDPLIGIPGVLLTTHNYNEYLTSADTPEIIKEENMEYAVQALLKMIEVYEKDFIPKREFIGPLDKEKYGIGSTIPQFNLAWDYLIYSIDGKKSLSKLCTDFSLNYDHTLEIMDKLIKDGKISRSPATS